LSFYTGVSFTGEILCIDVFRAVKLRIYFTTEKCCGFSVVLFILRWADSYWRLQGLAELD